MKIKTFQWMLSSLYIKGAYYLFLAFFLTCGILYAVNLGEYPGRNDSIRSLETARHLVAGEGMATGFGHRLYPSPQVPGPEDVRQPGVTLFIAGLYYLFGENIPIIRFAYVLLIAAISWLLFSAASRISGSNIIGGLAGIYFLLSWDYSFYDFTNNNFLTLFTMLYLNMLSHHVHDARVPHYRDALLIGLIGGLGYIFKPTFIVNFGLFASVLLVMGPSIKASRIRGLNHLLFASAVFLTTISPYLMWSLTYFGKLMYHPFQQFYHTLRYYLFIPKLGASIEAGIYRVTDIPVYSLGEIIETFGIWAVLSAEWTMFISKMTEFVKYGEVPLVLMVFLLIVNRKNLSIWPLLGIVALYGRVMLDIHAMPMVDNRFMWSVLPVSLVGVAWLIGKHISARGEANWAWLSGNRTIQVCVVVFTLGMATKALMPLQLAYNSLSHAEGVIPTWNRAVSELPANAVFMTDDPHSITWFGKRTSVPCAPKKPEDNKLTFERYAPTHLLATNQKHPCVLDIPGKRLTMIANGVGSRRSWQLYAILSTQ